MSIILLTGLSGAGKTTIATRTAEMLKRNLITVEVIDGDEYRKSICNELGYSREDRIENIRRLCFIANTLSKHKIVTIISVVNPYEFARAEMKSLYTQVKIVWIKCELQVVIERDTKGLYRRALSENSDESKIFNLTGINDPYEEPGSADLVVDTSNSLIEESTKRLYDFIIEETNALEH